MPASNSTGKRGRVLRVTRVHEDRDIVRVEKEGAAGPVAEVVDHRTTRSSVGFRNKGKQAAALPAPGAADTDVVPETGGLDTQEAEELMSEAEELLHEPVRGGKKHVTTTHYDEEAGPSQLTQGNQDESPDAIPDSQHQIEEVHPETAGNESQEAPDVQEPESSAQASPERSAPAKSGGLVQGVKGLLSTIVHMGQEGRISVGYIQNSFFLFYKATVVIQSPALPDEPIHHVYSAAEGPSKIAAGKEQNTSKAQSPDKVYLGYSLASIIFAKHGFA